MSLWKYKIKRSIIRWWLFRNNIYKFSWRR